MKTLVDFFLSNRVWTGKREYQKARLIIFCDLITVLVDIFYIIISLIADFPQGVVLLSAAGCLYTINAFLFRTRIPTTFLGNMYCGIFFMVIMALGYYSGGLKQHSVILPWVLLVPAISLLLTNLKSAWTWWLVSFLALLGLSFLDREATPIFYNLQYDIAVVILLHSGLALIALVINTIFEKNTFEALQALELANHKIKSINDNLEELVERRTLDLENKNKALEEYAFINAHRLRGPVASILGLTALLDRHSFDPETTEILEHLKASTQLLDETVREIQYKIDVGTHAVEEEPRVLGKVS